MSEFNRQQHVFRFTMEGSDLTDMEVQLDGEWCQVPGFFFIANMFRAASKAVLERINEDIRADIEEMISERKGEGHE